MIVPRPYLKPQKVNPDPKLLPLNVRHALLGAVELVNWSGLARGSTAEALIAQTDIDAFNDHWEKILPHYGRWLCWIAFSVGAEGIISAAFRAHGRNPGSFGGEHGWAAIGLQSSEIGEVEEPIKHLADVRNRDAHWYEANRRDEEFQYVESEYVPALNLILKTVPRSITLDDSY